MAKLGKYSTGVDSSQEPKMRKPTPVNPVSIKSDKDVVMSKTSTGTTGRPVPVRRK